MSNVQTVMFSRLGFHFGAREKRKVATTIFSYKRYREILFQKVALCYLLHFVQDGSSKNALDVVCANMYKKQQMGEQTKQKRSPLTPLRRALFAP